VRKQVDGSQTAALNIRVLQRNPDVRHSAKRWQISIRRNDMHELIQIEYEAFVSDGGAAIGAVREVSPDGRPELIIYVENAGEFTIPLTVVEAVHSGKVILDCRKLDLRLRQAIGYVHDAETRG
jgi:hypothetical protein